MNLERVSAWLADCAGPVTQVLPVSGGDTAGALRAVTRNGQLFVKVVGPKSAAHLAAEASGLDVLRAAGALRVPEVIASGTDGRAAWLALEWLELGRASAQSERRLGERLAQQHRATADTFGLDHDNAIGASVQNNARCADWPTFFADRRLGIQRALAANKAHLNSLLDPLDQLIAAVPALLGKAQPEPALLHGDLWGGNWGTLRDDEPVVFDPAVYYGDREADLAMTELFGGFGAEFYAAYQATWPLDDGYALRRRLYNLYHVVNHANLFGGSYTMQALTTIQALLSAVR